MKVVLAKAHLSQLEDPDIKEELESVSDAINHTQIQYNNNAINYVFIKGIYDHTERKMITACLFVNRLETAIRELHGVLRLSFNRREAQIAKTVINFDEPFMGTLNCGEALLVHISIPVKGLSENEVFSFRDIVGNFDDVRITKVNN